MRFDTDSGCENLVFPITMSVHSRFTAALRTLSTSKLLALLAAAAHYVDVPNSLCAMGSSTTASAPYFSLYAATNFWLDGGFVVSNARRITSRSGEHAQRL